MIQQKHKPRNPSWQYCDLAHRVQFPPKHLAARLILWFLAKTANNSGRSYHGYRSITAHTGLTHTNISNALKFLRDDHKILTWDKGNGGQQGNGTNIYQLDLKAMKELVSKQGVFNAETGKLLIYSEGTSPATGDIREATPSPLEAGTSPFRERTSPLDAGTSPATGAKLSSDATLKYGNSQINQLLDVCSVSDCKSLIIENDNQDRTTRARSAQLVAPVSGVPNTEQDRNPGVNTPPPVANGSPKPEWTVPRLTVQNLPKWDAKRQTFYSEYEDCEGQWDFPHEKAIIHLKEYGGLTDEDIEVWKEMSNPEGVTV